MYSDIGGDFTYCVTSPSPKRQGNLRYKPNSCQAKFKMRAVASFNKLPGFPKFSGYKPMNYARPGMLTSRS
jgi:hypothetical protein